MKTKLLTIGGLLLFCLIIILPPLMYGYIYPNLGDDAAVHLEIIEKMQQGTHVLFRFTGYVIVGYPIIWVSNLTKLSIEAIFLWFNYLSLCLVGITIYLVFSRLVNRKTGWLALALSLWCAQGILFQFYYGQIFNIINMGIFLPILLYFTVRYLQEKKLYQLLMAMFFCCMFSSFHTSGIYLPFISLAILGCYFLYCLVKKKHISKLALVFGLGLVIFGAVAFKLFVPDISRMIKDILVSLGHAMAVPLKDYFLNIFSIPLLILTTFVCVYHKEIRGNIDGKLGLTFLLFVISLVLAVVAFARLSLDPFRQALDLATVFSLLLSVLAGVYIWTPQGKIASILVYIVVGFGLFHNMPTWLSYNNALSRADKEAIEYVNSLDYKYYNCSSEVASWIYDRFVKMDCIEQKTELLITRNLPMTPRSTEGNVWYDGSRIAYESSETDNLLKSFSDGKIVVDIYICK